MKELLKISGKTDDQIIKEAIKDYLESILRY